jgi:hypothetical protein
MPQCVQCALAEALSALFEASGASAATNTSTGTPFEGPDGVATVDLLTAPSAIRETSGGIVRGVS